MPANVDHVADTSGVELRRLCELYGDVIPDFVKRADYDKVMRPGRQPVTIYADPVNHQFSCHNAASTFLSAMFYHEKRAAFHPKDQARIESRLDHYIDYWAIRGPVDRFLERHGQRVKEAADELPDSAYAYVWVAEDGSKERWMRMTTPAEVKQAADALQSIAPRMPFTDRHVVAKRILHKMASFGAALPADQVEFLERQAGRGVCDPKRVSAMLEGRAKMAAFNPTLRAHVQKLAESVRSAPSLLLDPGTLVKLAATVYEVDMGLGIRPEGYGEAVPRPEDVLFEASFTKTAAALTERVATTSGTVYTKQALAGLPLSELRAVFGDDFADEVKSGADPESAIDPEKMAEVVATLPRPEAELLDRLMSENNIRPDMRKAASANKGFSRQQLAALAANYRG